MKTMLHKSFKPAKCKTALNLAKSRIKLMKNRKDIQVKQLKREIAQLLESKQDQSATIRVEHVIREEKMMAAYEMIEIYCELIVARLPIIESQKNCPPDLKEAIASLIFAAPRCGDITELQDARKHFTAKYGKDFASAAIELRPNSGVSRRLVEKLSVNAPDGPTKIKVLTAIAEEHNIQWEPSTVKDEDPLPSVDILNVTKDVVDGNKIQMQPPNVEIADDFEEKHEPDTGKPGTSFQSHSHASSDLVPPSISHLDSRYSENNSSEKIAFHQPYGTSESVSSARRPKWNSEFKDATSAAQAAAESAELASIAARAAAELSIRSNVMSETSSVYSQSHGQGQSQKFQRAASGQQHGHVSRSSTIGSFNQRSTRMKSQQDLDRQDNMTDGIDPTSSYKDYSEFRAPNERREQDFRESKSDIRHGRDFDSSPVTPKSEPNVFKSSNFSKYELESTENPFYEEPGEREHQPSIFQSHSSDVGDDYGDFASLNYDKYDDYDSGDGSSGSFSRKTVDQDVWQLRSTYSYGGQDHREEHRVSGGEDLFKNQREGSRDLESNLNDGFQSNRDIFVGMENEVGRKDNDDKSIHPNDNVVFDESGSDDDRFALNSSEEHDTFTPSKLAYNYKASAFNPDNTQSEPDLSKSFRSSSIYSKLNEPLPVNYDSDGAGSGSEEEHQVEKTDAGVASFEKPDASRHLEFMTSLDVGKAKGDALKTSKNLNENQNRDENSEYEDGNQLRPEGGMELNLLSLPGGRRNRAHWRIPRDGMTGSPITTNFSYREKPSAFESSSHRPKPKKMDGFHTKFDPPTNGNELESTPNDSDNSDGSYGAISRVSVRKTSHNDPSGYFVSDNSEPEEDVPKPVMSNTFVSAGLSRRTKASAPRSKTGQTSQTSSSYTTKVSSSRNIDKSSHDYEASTFGQNFGSKASKGDKNSYSAVADNSAARASSNVTEASRSNAKAPSRENSAKLPSHVHPKLPDFETFTAHLQSLRKNRQ